MSDNKETSVVTIYLKAVELAADTGCEIKVHDDHFSIVDYKECYFYDVGSLYAFLKGVQSSGHKVFNLE